MFQSIGAMVKRKRTFLEQDEWKHIPWALQPMSKTIGDFLQDILCDIPGMMEDLDNLSDALLEHSISACPALRMCLFHTFDSSDRANIFATGAPRAGSVAKLLQSAMCRDTKGSGRCPYGQ